MSTNEVKLYLSSITPACYGSWDIRTGDVIVASWPALVKNKVRVRNFNKQSTTSAWHFNWNIRRKHVINARLTIDWPPQLLWNSVRLKTFLIQATHHFWFTCQLKYQKGVINAEVTAHENFHRSTITSLPKAVCVIAVLMREQVTCWQGLEFRIAWTQN